MSQNPLTYPGSYPSQPSKPSPIKPQLAAALASLEVQLDQELARYRRTRPQGMRTPVFGANPPSFVVDNPNLAANPENQAATSQALATDLPTPPSFTEVNENSSIDSNRESKLPPTEIPGTNLNISTPPQTETNPNIETNSFPSAELNPELEPQNLATAPTQETQLNSAGIVPVSKTNNNSTSKDTKFAVPGTSEPDDYLESSEALLRSLTESEPQSPSSSQQNQKNNSLLSPLGIGSMLLLVVASAILGMVLFQPKFIPELNFSKLFPRNQTNSSENNPSSGANSAPVEPQLTPVPQYPNLANDEFPEVKNPNDIVGLTPKPSPTSPPVVNQQPNPVTQPVAPAQPINPVPPTPPQPTVQPTPQPQPITDADLKPSPNGMYQFVVENQGETALANARKIVPDAYLSRDRKYIHVGAVSTKERAKKLLAELKAKGLDVRPYQP
ncbi:hypothetical protein [Calothrix sp. NIES-3974]|uniref:hypothetical protein n=1 Tax=Calothrix sp. NIES-3974 TaxID=2005462 RepID=UPI000B600E66|nr:hypothetical protein [Calothrix sp. NIES-3974]BAZ03472.1 hypothetical protein NIES3974_00980 [Calothrix sp. NIES-3974]